MNLVLISTNGTEWNSYNSNSRHSLEEIAYGDGLWVAVGGNAKSYERSITVRVLRQDDGDFPITDILAMIWSQSVS